MKALNLTRSIIMWARLAVRILGSGGQDFVQAVVPGLVRILVSFKHRPGDSEKSLVRNADGKVNHNYHLVPPQRLPFPGASSRHSRPTPW